MSHLPPEIFELPLTEAQKEELDRRWQAFQANPDEGEPWETLKKSLLGE